ncbi:MAG: ATP-binding protein [Methanobacterium sp.]|nr:ATP-binding protein [Methanobacterium sp.]
MPIIIACAMLDEACFNGVALILDITERKEMEKALKKSEEEYKHLVNYAPTAIYEIDFKGPNFKSVNQAFCKLLSYTKEELFKINPFDILDNESKQKFQERIEKGLTGEKIDENIEYKIIDKNSILDGALVIGHDITERINGEHIKQQLLDKEQQLTEKLQASNEKLISTTKKLQQANNELVRAQNSLKDIINKLMISNRELEQFAYVASHDLQEPLRMVSSFTQLLQRRYKDQLDGNADDYINFIVDGAQRMKKLIDDLLAYSRLNTTDRVYELIEMDLLLEDVLINLKAAINDTNANIIHKNLPTIHGDPIQISQLLQNIIGNAIKFHGNKPPQIKISAKQLKEHWLFSVNDNGIGIEPKHQEQIFNIFKRLHTREEYDGTGIGLSICKRIIERHWGEIWLESEKGEGKTFYFTISLKK